MSNDDEPTAKTDQLQRLAAAAQIVAETTVDPARKRALRVVANRGGDVAKQARSAYRVTSYKYDWLISCFFSKKYPRPVPPFLLPPGMTPLPLGSVAPIGTLIHPPDQRLFSF